MGYLDRLGRGSRVWNRIKYPGIQAARGASFYVDGTFLYGSGCSIGVGANIVVQRYAHLELGDNCYVGRFVETGPTGRIRIGSHTSIQDRCIILGEVSIGRYCLFAPNVYVSSGRHHFDIVPPWLIQDQDEHVARDAQLSAQYSRPVIVEDDCWLGINSVVMQGVTIGKGAVVGAGSVVAHDVAPYSVVVGAPAREIRKRLDFSPPKRVTYCNPEDWPYFYAGFDLSRRSLQEYSAHEGIAAKNEFVICMDASSVGRIHIVVKSQGGPECGLLIGGQLNPLGKEFREVVLDNNPPLGRAARIRAQVVPTGATVVVREAWIQ